MIYILKDLENDIYPKDIFDKKADILESLEKDPTVGPRDILGIAALKPCKFADFDMEETIFYTDSGEQIYKALPEQISVADSRRPNRQFYRHKAHYPIKIVAKIKATLE